MSYTKNVYHIIFGTYAHKRTISASGEHELYAYLNGIAKAKGGLVYAVNGTEDHIHILCDVPPTISIADFVKALKQSSSVWMKESRLFPYWEGWSKGYAGFTCSFHSMQRVVDYVNHQKAHHAKMSFGSELRSIFKQLGINYDERYIPA